MRQVMIQSENKTTAIGRGLRICHLATTRLGGAGIAASRLHDALFRQAVASTFLTEDRGACGDLGYAALPPETRTWFQRLRSRLGMATSDRQRWTRQLESLDRNGVFASGPGGRDDACSAG